MAVLCLVVRVLYRRWGLDGAIGIYWRHVGEARWKRRERIMSLTALTGGAVHLCTQEIVKPKFMTALICIC